jgi:hypothetical protein
MVLTTDSRIFSFCKCLDKQIASGRKIQMEKIILGMQWKSKAVITDFGWVVEMRIPYAAPVFQVKTN